MRPYSIARRMIVIVLLVELVSALCVTGLALLYERHAHFRSFDIMLRGRADSVLGAVQDAEDTDDNVMLDRADLDLPKEDIYEVHDEKGRLLGRSPNLTDPVDSLASLKDGFTPLTINHRHYRVLKLHGLRVVDPGEKGGGFPRHVTIVYGSPTRRVWHAVFGAVRFYAFASLLLLIITGLLMAWLLHRGLSPLRELATEASGVSVHTWQFTPPERARLTKELAPLTEAIEAVLHRLEQSFLQQRHFVSDAAHELKTAVAVVKSSLQLLGIKERSAEEYREGLERSLADCSRMEDLVAKMLTLARVENYDASSNSAQSASDLAHCARQTIDQLESVAELRRIRIVLSAQTSAIAALPEDDASLLFSNLLMNALQHSNAGAQINISLKQQSGFIELQVGDRGEGIDPEILPHVFERFYRGDPSRNRNTGGTGLGLAICHAIVQKAKGSIDISSQPEQGTIVTVRLPFAIPVDIELPKFAEIHTLPSA